MLFFEAQILHQLIKQANKTLMKNKLLYLMAGFMAIIMISSCKTGSEVISDRGIQKRKYNKGFYMAQKSNAPKPAQVNGQENETATELADDQARIIAPLPISEQSGNFASAPVTEALLDRPSLPVDKTAKRATGSEAQTAVPQKPNHRRMGPSAFKIKTRPSVSTGTPLEVSERASDDTETLLLVILAILLPPLAVYLLRGIGTEFWISLILTLLFWLPGIIYALYLILA